MPLDPEMFDFDDADQILSIKALADGGIEHVNYHEMTLWAQFSSYEDTDESGLSPLSLADFTIGI